MRRPAVRARRSDKLQVLVLTSGQAYHVFFRQNPPPKIRRALSRTEMSLGCLVRQNIFKIRVDDFQKITPGADVR
jgi:hypothetical protein